MKTTQISFILLILSATVMSATKEEWKSRTIYQLLTDRFWRDDGSTNPCPDLHKYCGGTFKGIIAKLDYIQNMGFDAVWISPVVENTDGGYHGYWAKDLYKVNNKFGTAQDLKDLSAALHQRGMWLMVDVVANHMAEEQPHFDFSQFSPFDKAEHYHDYCVINGDDFKNNQWRVENCRLANLADLKQENPFVREELQKWIKFLVQEYNVDGLRIDTIPEVPKDFWSEFSETAGIYTVGECFDNRTAYVASYQGHVDGLLNYPLYFAINNFYAYGQSGYGIRTALNDINKQFKDVSVLGVFVDNHDNERFLHKIENHQRLKNALALTLFSQGIPIMYYGTEQGYAGAQDPFNREQLWTNMDPENDLYKFVTTLVKYRKKMKVWNLDYVERYVDDSLYAFSRGTVLVVTTNSNAGQVQHYLPFIPYKNGDTVCNILFGLQDCVQVKNGVLETDLNKGETKIFVLKSDL